MPSIDDARVLRDAMAYMDWLSANANWLTPAIASYYSISKADEFSALEVKARETREGVRAIFTRI